MATMSGGQKTLLASSGAMRILTANDFRKRIIIQVISGGNAYYNGGNADVTSVTGMKIVTGASFIDDPPFVHCGEIWVAVDADNTVVYIA